MNFYKIALKCSASEVFVCITILHLEELFYKKNQKPNAYYLIETMKPLRKLHSQALLTLLYQESKGCTKGKSGAKYIGKNKNS